MKHLRFRILAISGLALVLITLTSSNLVSANYTPRNTSGTSAVFGTGFTSLALMPDDPEAIYRGARVVHNITVNGQKGMRVHANFQVRYGKGVHCEMIAYFYDHAGRPLRGGSDPLYVNAAGKVSAYTQFTPSYDPAEYNDLEIFLPYNALNLTSGNQYEIKFVLQLYDETSKRFFGKSEFYNFTVTM